MVAENLPMGCRGRGVRAAGPRLGVTEREVLYVIKSGGSARFHIRAVSA